MFSRIQAIDTAIFEWVKAHQFPLVSYAARDVTSLGGNVCVFAVTVYVTILHLVSGSPRLGWFFAGGVFWTAALITVLKVLIGRPCPLQPDPYQVGIPHHMSFDRCSCYAGAFPLPHLPCMPSGHTMGSTVLYGMLAHIGIGLWPELSGILWWTGFSLPVAIGITRILLSAHWTSDVIVGFGLGHTVLDLWRLLT